MPIKVPGHRDRHGKMGASKRSAVAVLQVTAMVDMFTVLAVFLLQNFGGEQLIQISEEVQLPQARSVKELKPSNVVIISKEEIKYNNEKVADYQAIKEQEENIILGLDEMLKESIEAGEEEKKSLANQIKEAVNKREDSLDDELDSFRKLTIQADQEVNYGAVEKVMITALASGIYEVNFAVLKRKSDELAELAE